MNDKIDDALGLGGDRSVPSIDVLPPGQVTPTKPEDDFEYARRNLRELIDGGLESVQNISQIAVAAESPRAFEALAALIDKVTVANEKLLTVAVKRAEADNAAGGAANKVFNTQNNIYVGNPADLLRALKPQEQDE